MKLGTIVLAFVALLALGSVLAPFAVAIWAVASFSLAEIIKGALIIYIALIPISMLSGRSVN
jgi:hypothetical protein